MPFSTRLHQRLTGSESGSITSISSDSSEQSSRSSSVSSISRTSESKDILSIPTRSGSGYDLPCDFQFIGCNVRFDACNFEDWFSHSLSHFHHCPPPPFSICTFCDSSVFRDDTAPYANWRERMLHIRQHFVEGTAGYSRPDYWVLEHMAKNDLLNEQDYTFGLKYCERPDYHSILQTKAEVIAVSKERKYEFFGGHEANRIDECIELAQARSRRKANLASLQGSKVLGEDYNAAKSRKSPAKPRKQWKVFVTQAGREDPEVAHDIPTLEKINRNMDKKEGSSFREHMTTDFLQQWSPKIPCREVLNAPASSYGSSVSETIYSADETDWEEDSPDHENHEDQMKTFLFDIRQILVGSRLDKQIWNNLSKTFNENWHPNIQQRGGPSTSSSTSISGSSSNSRFLSEQRSAKRFRQLQSDENGGDDGDDLMELRDLQKRPPGVSLERMFACPFRKHDPAKYCLHDWPRCALTSHATVARVKAHLYKYHLIHQCPRCKELFDSEDDVKSHLEATQACNAKPPIVVDGVTKAMQEQIKSRKRAFKGQTELNRWEQIYQILFPGEILPDPRADSFLSSNYARHALNSVDFEAVEDREMKLKEDQTTGNISDFQEHLLAQLPRLFDRSLVLASGFDLPPVEDELRRRASTLFQEALTAMLSSYRSSLNQITGEATSPNMQLTAQIPSEAPNRSFANLAISATGSADSGYLSQHAGNDFVVPCPQDREQYLGALMPDSMGQGRHIPAHEMPPSAPRVALTRNGTSQTAGNAESSGEGPIVQELDGFESHLETSGMNPLAANGVVFVVPGSLPDSWLGRGVSDVMDEWMSWNESQN